MIGLTIRIEDSDDSVMGTFAATVAKTPENSYPPAAPTEFFFDRQQVHEPARGEAVSKRWPVVRKPLRGCMCFHKIAVNVIGGGAESL